MAKYFDSRIELVSNFSNIDLGFVGPPIIYNDALCFIYRDSNNYLNLVYYKEGRLTKVLNPDNENNFTKGDVQSYYLFKPVVFQNQLFYLYRDKAYHYHLAKFNGSTIQLIRNPINGSMYYSEINNNPYFTEFDGTLFFIFNPFKSLQLGYFDGQSITILTNPDNVLESSSGVKGHLFATNDFLIFRYLNKFGKYQLCKWANNKFDLIDNISMSDIGYLGYPIKFDNKIYFIYHGFSNSQLGLLDEQSNSIKLIGGNSPNYSIADPFANFKFRNEIYPLFDFQNKLYFGYSSNIMGLGFFDANNVEFVKRNINMTFLLSYYVEYNSNLYFTVEPTSLVSQSIILQD
ncbi:MAG: hypothetical protein IPM92_16535 [Saprospiraceae bacterium]|nr:hypothetical protein [Saprospiraceae bacterium]